MRFTDSHLVVTQGEVIVDGGTGFRLVSSSADFLGGSLSLLGCVSSDVGIMSVSDNSHLTVASMSTLRITNSSGGAQWGLHVVDGSSANVFNLVIANIDGDHAIFVQNADVIATRALIANNDATAVYANYSNFALYHSVVASNSGDLAGALLAVNRSMIYFEDVRIYNNNYNNQLNVTDHASAGAVLLIDAAFEANSCTFDSNGYRYIFS